MAGVLAEKVGGWKRGITRGCLSDRQVSIFPLWNVLGKRKLRVTVRMRSRRTLSTRSFVSLRVSFD